VAAWAADVSSSEAVLVARAAEAAADRVGYGHHLGGGSGAARLGLHLPTRSRRSNPHR